MADTTVSELTITAPRRSISTAGKTRIREYKSVGSKAAGAEKNIFTAGSSAAASAGGRGFSVGASTFSGLAGATESIFGGIAQGKAAKGYKQAAKDTLITKELVAQNQRLQALQAGREIYRVLGGQRADIASAGLKASGSALDVIRASAAEGSLTQSLIGVQGAIDQHQLDMEYKSYIAQAKAAKKSKLGSFISGGLQIAGAAAAVFSDERMKTDIKLVERRPDGIGIYHFRYNGSPVVFEGVMAQDVQTIRPEAVYEEDGLLQVDYDAIGVTPRVVKEG